jgi:hypothetical protein
MMKVMSFRGWALAALVVMLALPIQASAAGRGSRSGGGYRPKTVHVNGYKKKNGTVVKSYKRRAPR